MPVLITGGAGYVGTRLAESLTARGEEVRILDLACGSMPASAVGKELVPSSIMDAQAVQRAMQGCDRVFHLAACARNWDRDVTTFYRVNAIGTDIVLASALRAHVDRFVLVSSNVVLGPSNGSPVAEADRRNAKWFTAYERSKIVAEHFSRAYARRGLDVVIVNPTRVFGPGLLSESNGVTRLIDLYLRGKWRVMPGDGSALGNYVFVDDLVEGLLRAMEHGRAGENYLLGGENLSFKSFFEVLSSVTGVRRRMVPFPAGAALAFAHWERVRSTLFHATPLVTPGWVKTFLTNWEVSSRKAQVELGYSITPFRTALRKTVEWLNKEREPS